MMELGRTNRHTDCTFIIEDESGGSQSFPCHKLLFSCASDVFDRMLYGDYIESTSGVVRLNDVQPDILRNSETMSTAMSAISCRSTTLIL